MNQNFPKSFHCEIYSKEWYQARCKEEKLRCPDRFKEKCQELATITNMDEINRTFLLLRNDCPFGFDN